MRRKDRAQEKRRKIQKKTQMDEITRLVKKWSFLTKPQDGPPHSSFWGRSNYLDIARRAFPIQPMTSPVGAIFYYDDVYPKTDV